MPSHRSPSFAAGLLVLAAIAITLLAPSALAATPLSVSGETLNGSGTTSMSNPLTPTCPFFVNNGGSFAVSGTATGPYPGTFVENGTFAVSGQHRNPFSTLHAYFNATFTIKSQTMLPITGALSGSAWGAMCWVQIGYTVGMPIGYTLTGNYSGGGAPGWPVSGALVNATFHTDTPQATIRESFAP
jgi:hypothetical protein